MQITVIIFLTLITLFELKIYKSNIKSLKSYVGYYKFIKSNKNIKFKKVVFKILCHHQISPKILS